MSSLKDRMKNSRELESMFMKHYSPNGCEPNIEVIVKMGVGVGVGGGGGGSG